MADPSFFQNFLNKVGRGYGQLDKNIFGGLLPGGAATPIGAALQNTILPKGIIKPNPTERRVASLLDATAGALAGAQPVIQRTIQSMPGPVQEGIASGLNALPFSANLFSRYYTGMGNKNLEVPESITSGLKDQLNKLRGYQPLAIKNLKEEVQGTSQMLDRVRKGTLKPLKIGSSEYMPTAQELNNALAETKSRLNRITKGDIPVSYYSGLNSNPLTSAATSIGRTWFKPKDQGYQANEKYDFMYADADRTDIQGPFLNNIPFTPSQLMSLNAAQKIVSGKQPLDPTMNPLTNFGRAVVSKLPDKSFDYLINVP